MCPYQKKLKLSHLANKYRFAFILFGTPDIWFNAQRISTFKATKNPKEYELFVEEDERTFVFWNPYEKDCVEQS